MVYTGHAWSAFTVSRFMSMYILVCKSIASLIQGAASASNSGLDQYTSDGTSADACVYFGQNFPKLSLTAMHMFTL